MNLKHLAIVLMGESGLGWINFWAVKYLVR
jgi:hypothetical protein